MLKKSTFSPTREREKGKGLMAQIFLEN